MDYNEKKVLNSLFSDIRLTSYLRLKGSCGLARDEIRTADQIDQNFEEKKTIPKQ